MGKRNMRQSAMLVGNSSESTWVLGEHTGNIHGNLMGTWVPPPPPSLPPSPTLPQGGEKKNKEEKWALLLLGMLELMKFHS